MIGFRAYETILVEGPDDVGVVTITLNRPEHNNAFTHQMHLELTDAMRVLRNPVDVGAVVLTGAGKMFSAGGDMTVLQDFTSGPTAEIYMFEEASHMLRDFLTIRPPVISAINGHAAGLAATFALLSDIVYMAESARVADTHVRAGLVAGDGGAVVWPALIGPSRAKEYLLTGDPMDAATAFQLGLVNHVEPDDLVVERAVAMARRLASGPRHAIAWTKQAVNVKLLADTLAVLPMSLALEARTIHHPDLLEGTTAFLEKRAPAWPSATTAAPIDEERPA